MKVHMQKKHELLIYGKAGIRKAFHNEFRSNFRNADKTCRAGYYHGYKTYQGMKIVENDALNKKVLVVSTHSAFDNEYMVDLVTDIKVYAATFESVAKKILQIPQPKASSGHT